MEGGGGGAGAELGLEGRGVFIDVGIQRHTAKEEKRGARRGNGLSLIIVQSEGLFERGDEGQVRRGAG
jgi:hypothetical protein